MEAHNGPEIHLRNAKQHQLFLFVANIHLMRPDGRILLLQRSTTEKVHPGKWAVPGGKLAWDDLPPYTRVQEGPVHDTENILERLLAREVAEETGLTVDTGTLEYITSTAFVRPDGTPAVLLKMAARVADGPVTTEEGAFIGHQWATPAEADALPCIAGIADEMRVAQAKLGYAA